MHRRNCNFGTNLLSWFRFCCDIAADLPDTRASRMLRARVLFLLLLAAAVQIGSYLAAACVPKVRACFQASRNAESAVKCQSTHRARKCSFPTWLM
jgi:hypothetical protein